MAFAAEAVDMGNIGLPEILVIAVVAVLLFGAGRIADIGKGLGQGIKNFKQGLKEAEEIGADKPSAEKKALAAPPAAEVRELAARSESSESSAKRD
jgi:sec-independent protein translocase protein TatA